jgi:hypothetical protein
VVTKKKSNGKELIKVKRKTINKLCSIPTCASFTKTISNVALEMRTMLEYMTAEPITVPYSPQLRMETAVHSKDLIDFT